ncbi:MAG: c-type cytochrome, partial [Terracidiphilus sp.]
MGRVLLGVLLGILLVPVVVLGWLRFGSPPVAVADPPFFQERLLTGIPLHARIDRELASRPVNQPDEGSLVAGAEIYSEKCAFCHGFQGKPSVVGKHIYPAAPPLWEKHHHNGSIGVSDDPPGETYWKVANGIRLTGMPAYKGVLTDTEIWQVSLLLANADKPLPGAAVDILRGQAAPVTAAIAAPV